MTFASGALQLMVVCPKMALSATGMGFGLAVRDGPTEGQGALTEVTQTLPSNAFAPVVARFRISKPLLVEGWSTVTCAAGFPSTRFPRKMFPWTPAARKIPFVFPATVLSSTTLPVLAEAMRPIPKLLT
jgi:hypothetical protein